VVRARECIGDVPIRRTCGSAAWASRHEPGPIRRLGARARLPSTSGAVQQVQPRQVSVSLPRLGISPSYYRWMTEVAQALLLPSVEGPGIASLLSAALVWDRVLVPRFTRQSNRAEDRPAGLVLERLEEEGVVHEVALPLGDPHAPQPRGGFHAIDEALAIGVAERMPAPKLEARVWAALQEATNEVADHQSARLRSAVALCEHLGAAPVANGLFALIAPILPPLTTGAPVREGTLISIAAEGIGVDGTTNVEDVLRFRDQHAAGIGRLRTSLIDLAATIRQDGPPLALLEEARAVLSNRVEPALASLEALLKEGRGEVPVAHDVRNGSRSQRVAANNRCSSGDRWCDGNAINLIRL
jgi:hypothetical protein